MSITKEELEKRIELKLNQSHGLSGPQRLFFLGFAYSMAEVVVLLSEALDKIGGSLPLMEKYEPDMTVDDLLDLYKKANSQRRSIANISVSKAKKMLGLDKSNDVSGGG